MLHCYFSILLFKIFSANLFLSSAWIVRIMGRAQMKIEKKKNQIASDDDDDEEIINPSQKRKAVGKITSLPCSAEANGKKKKVHNDGLVLESQTMDCSSDSESE